MFCPECKSEYRQGFNRCADCDVELVSELSMEASQGVLRRIWAGNDEATCVGLCLQLKKAGIVYEVGRYIQARGISMDVHWKYELAVSAANEEKAKELLGLPPTVVEENEELTEEDEDQALLELPEGDAIAAKERKRDSYLDSWYPEDATVEICLQTSSDDSDMVEMALKENLIRVRTDLQEDGSKKYFVLPEDETAARRIVREIEANSPNP